MNKKLVLTSLVGTGVVGLALAIPLISYAQTSETDSPATTFVQKLAAKLGLDEVTVQSAVDEVHTEMKTERETKYKEDLAQAVIDGKLTQRQADILIALLDIQPEKPEKPADLADLTEEERQSKMEELRAQMQQNAIDALNAQGLNVTADELKSTREAARDAGIMGMRMGIGFGGPRGMMF